MDFDIISDITDTSTIAVEGAIRELERLQELYGHGRWFKRKGAARIGLPNGSVRRAELHWYEAHGVGRKEFKIKRFLKL
jgi:hypothetical protein